MFESEDFHTSFITNKQIKTSRLSLAKNEDCEKALWKKDYQAEINITTKKTRLPDPRSSTKIFARPMVFKGPFATH